MTMERMRVGAVLRLERVPVEPDPAVEYVSIGIRSFGKGIFHYEPKRGDQLGSLRFFEVQPNRLVLSNIKGWEGAIAVSSDVDAGCLASNRFLSYVPIDDRIDVRWARWYFLSDPGIQLIQRASPGSADRNRTLAIDRFEELEIPLPAPDDQRRVVDWLARLESRTRATATAMTHSATNRDSLMSALRNAVFASVESDQRNLADLAVVEMGQSPPGEAYNETGDGLPLLNGPTEFGPEFPRARQWTTAITKIAEPGDLLICVRGATTGRMNWADQRYCIGRGLAAIRPKPELLDSAYLRHALLHLAPEIMSRTAGSTFANLPGTRLVLLPIQVPALSTQRRLAARMSEAERATRHAKALGQRSHALLQSIVPAALNQVFASLS